jgi:hypothetical protein
LNAKWLSLVIDAGLAVARGWLSQASDDFPTGE